MTTRRVKGLTLSKDVWDVANNLSNLNGAVNWLLRRLKNDNELQKELELTTGIRICVITPSNNEPPKIAGHQASEVIVNDWGVDA